MGPAEALIYLTLLVLGVLGVVIALGRRGGGGSGGGGITIDNRPTYGGVHVQGLPVPPAEGGGGTVDRRDLWDTIADKALQDAMREDPTLPRLDDRRH